MALLALRMLGRHRRSRSRPRPHPVPRSPDEVGAEHSGFSSGSNLRAAVFGVNDGLVSNTGLIMGVAGATGDLRAIAVTGVAGLLAGALSMAAGEFVSVSSQRELYQKQIEQERQEIARFPRQETEEIAMIYRNRGVPEAQARRLAEALMRDPDRALETHTREELGLDPEDLGSPFGAAGSSLASFALGAAVPLAPFFAHLGAHAVEVSAALAGACLFGTGVLVNRFTDQGLLWGGARMLLIGGGAAAITYFIGALLGVGPS